MSSRILVVDDEPDILELVRLNLSQDGHSVDTAANGKEAMERMQKNPPDLVILDLMLPGMSGFEVARRARAAGVLVPILMLTAKDDVQDLVRGLEEGADDYLTKPFSMRELVARVRSLLRRVQLDRQSLGPAQGSAVLLAPDLAVDPAARKVTSKGREVPLRPKEITLRSSMRLMGRLCRTIEEFFSAADAAE